MVCPAFHFGRYALCMTWHLSVRPLPVIRPPVIVDSLIQINDTWSIQDIIWLGSLSTRPLRRNMNEERSNNWQRFLIDILELSRSSQLLSKEVVRVSGQAIVTLPHTSR